jgi:probable rRNA maturation factor
MKFDFKGFTADEKKTVKFVIQTAVKTLKQPSKLLVCVSCVGKDEIRSLNKIYRETDRPTDVLSFPTLYRTSYDIIDIERYPTDTDEQGYLNLGDICICREMIGIQADEYGHSRARELGFLSLHGLLHLLGYDHMIEQDRIEMERVQDEILGLCGIGREV